MELFKNRFFSCFGESGAKALAEQAHEVSFKDQEIIFEEGDSSDSVYLVQKGRVELSKNSRGKLVKIAEVEGGDYFGELGVLDGYVRSARATSWGAVRGAKISREALMQTLYQETPQASLQFFKRVSDLLRSTNDRFVEQILKKEKLHLIGEMASTIIHDFKNPITAIQLSAELIAHKHHDDPTQNRTRIIIQQAQRIVTMVQELLDFARENFNLKKEIQTVAELFEQFHSLNEDFFEQSGVKVVMNPISSKIEVDSGRLLRVFQNLVTNAIEAMHGKGDLTISARENGEWVEIRIQDTGPGIPEEIRNSLFEPFVTFGKKDGTGLGMAIVKAIVEAHRGQIFFETETGKGTTFFVRLPKSK